jgi:hypothetical protein
MHRRTLASLLLALLTAGACATEPLPPGVDAASRDAAGIYATRLVQADQGVAATIARLDALEQHTRDNAAAIAFALRRPAPPAPSRSARTIAADEAVDAAGQVLDVGFDALVAGARYLAALATGQPPTPPANVNPDALATQARDALAILRRPVAGVGGPPRGSRAAAAVASDPSSPGVAAIARLAAPPPAGADLRTVAMQRHGDVEALAVLLLSVVGDSESTGLRAAMAAGRRTAERDHAALMAAAQRDGSLGVMGRYDLHRRARPPELGEPPEEVLLEAIADMLRRLPAAHGAVVAAAGDPAEATRRLQAFGEAVERLWAELQDVEEGAM